MNKIIITIIYIGFLANFFAGIGEVLPASPWTIGDGFGAAVFFTLFGISFIVCYKIWNE